MNRSTVYRVIGNSRRQFLGANKNRDGIGLFRGSPFFQFYLCTIMDGLVNDSPEFKYKLNLNVSLNSILCYLRTFKKS